MTYPKGYKPSKAYKPQRSRDFPIEWFIFLAVLIGGSAIAIYYGILLSVDKYGPQILSGWTIESTLTFVVYVALFFLSLIIARRMFRNIIGKTKLTEMTGAEFLIFRYGSIIVAFVILSLGLVVLGYFATDNLALDP